MAEDAQTPSAFISRASAIPPRKFVASPAWSRRRPDLDIQSYPRIPKASESAAPPPMRLANRQQERDDDPAPNGSAALRGRQPLDRETYGVDLGLSSSSPPQRPGRSLRTDRARAIRDVDAEVVKTRRDRPEGPIRDDGHCSAGSRPQRGLSAGRCLPTHPTVRTPADSRVSRLQPCMCDLRSACRLLLECRSAVDAGIGQAHPLLERRADDDFAGRPVRGWLRGGASQVPPLRLDCPNPH